MTELETTICIALGLVVALFIARTVVYGFGRILGLSHPNQYNKWPRIPWRPVYELFSKFSKWRERVFKFGKQSTGGFAGLLATLCLMYRPGKVFLGRAYGFGVGLLMPVGATVKRHLFCCAQTGTGKTTMVISLISMWVGSVYLIDPKGQIIRAISALDSRKWYIFDFIPNSGFESISINFIDVLKEAMQREGNDAAVRWATRISHALVATPEGAKSPYFYEVSRGFIFGLILHVLSKHPPEHHHLPFVRDLIVHQYRIYDDGGSELTKGDEARALLLQSMKDNTAFGGVIAGAAAAMESASDETAGNVRSTLQEQTQFLDYPDVRKRLMSSDISLSELKTRDDIVLAFSAPLSSLNQELSPLARLLTNMISYTFEAVPDEKMKGECIAVIDEMPSQKYNPIFEIIWAAGRSSGLLLFGITQSVELMARHYTNSWKTAIGEADFTWWMGGNHNDNKAFLAHTLGNVTVVDRDPQTGRKSYRQAATMDAEQIGRFLDPDSDNLIVTRASGRALMLKNDPFFKALPVKAYAADPKHKETFFRRWSRRFFG